MEPVISALDGQHSVAVIPPMGGALSQSYGKHGPISRKSVNTTMMTSTELIEISTTRIIKDDSRITSSRVQSDLEKEAGDVVSIGKVQEIKAGFIGTEVDEGIEQ